MKCYLVTDPYRICPDPQCGTITYSRRAWLRHRRRHWRISLSALRSKLLLSLGLL